MPKIAIRHAHHLSREQAHSQVEAIASELTQKYALTGGWKGDSYEFQRTGLKGLVRIEDGRISVELDLAFVLTPLKAKIEERVREKLQKDFV